MLDIISLLKEKKLTVTPQRVEIVNLLSTNRHINVDELYALLHSSFPSISLATVYKNLNTMLANKILSEVQIPNKKNLYELAKEEHSHVVCTECDAILELVVNLEEIYKEAHQKSDYSLESSRLVFTGKCSECTVS
ncbi:MAG: transcriptional repressor [Helicobacteraceae bacterium]|nr:transcriptional repressor [Candidatus Sulfurimonas ponti]MBL6973507.1 transcriptional repressor [Sulfurimonas sp.]